MRLATLISGLVIFLHLGCSQDDPGPESFRDDPEINTLNGTFKLFSIDDYQDNSRILKTDDNSDGLDVIITFDDTKDPHEFTGTSTTNLIFGQFEYSGLRKVKILQYSSTEVMQPEWADMFNDAMGSGELDFKINSTGLRLYYANGTKGITLVRQ